MNDTPIKALQLRSVDTTSTLCDHRLENYINVVSGDRMSDEVTDFPDDSIRQMDGCSIALDEHIALIVREPRCTNDTWKSALAWVKEKGFIGEPAWLGEDSKEPDLEVWAVAKFEEVE